MCTLAVVKWDMWCTIHTWSCHSSCSVSCDIDIINDVIYMTNEFTCIIQISFECQAVQGNYLTYPTEITHPLPVTNHAHLMKIVNKVAIVGQLNSTPLTWFSRTTLWSATACEREATAENFKASKVFFFFFGHLLLLVFTKSLWWFYGITTQSVITAHCCWTKRRE